MGRILAAAVLTLALAASQETPVFRVDVKLVRLLVTVKNAAGDPVGSLDRDVFTVLDNGVAQEIAVFERHTAVPLSIAVLIDTSASTAKELKYEIASVMKFLEALFREGNPKDEARLYSFNWQVARETPFTRRAARFDQALRRLKPEGGTSLYDAIHVASRDLEARDGRRVIVLITDGGDTTSALKYHDALEAAHRADAPIYSVLVMPITNDPGRNIGGENALTTLAQSTGGKVFTPSVGAALDSAFAEILRDLRTQYLIGYYPRNVPLTKNRFHRIEVRMNRPDLRAESRSGYYGDASP